MEFKYRNTTPHSEGKQDIAHAQVACNNVFSSFTTDAPGQILTYFDFIPNIEILHRLLDISQSKAGIESGCIYFLGETFWSHDLCLTVRRAHVMAEASVVR